MIELSTIRPILALQHDGDEDDQMLEINQSKNEDTDHQIWKRVSSTIKIRNPSYRFYDYFQQNHKI